jgi:hypothetical protein
MVPFLIAGVMPLVDNFAHVAALLVGFALSMTIHAVGPFAALLKRRRAVVHGVCGVLWAGGLLVIGITVFFAVHQIDEWCGFCHAISCPAVADWRCASSATASGD